MFSQLRGYRYRAAILQAVSKIKYTGRVPFVEPAECWSLPGGSHSVKINDMITVNMHRLNIA